ncbi:hypothetical protein HID58_006325, partial [Brassica napus]
RDIQEGRSENAFVGKIKKEVSCLQQVQLFLLPKKNKSSTVSPSPAEANVFASSFVDATVAVWDVRVENSHALAFKEQKDEKDGMLGYHIFRSISILPRRLSKALSSQKDEAEFNAYTKEQLNRDKDLKELHRHNQIPGMIISTASDGFKQF